jgi:hypothetical protein
MDLTRLSAPQKLSAAAILTVTVSAFLPWISIFGGSVLGIQGDGVITLTLAIAGLVVLALGSVIGTPRFTGKKADITLVVLAVITALIGLLDMNGFAAIGLYLTLLGGLAWVGGAIWQLASATSTATSA